MLEKKKMIVETIKCFKVIDYENVFFYESGLESIVLSLIVGNENSEKKTQNIYQKIPFLKIESTNWSTSTKSPTFRERFFEFFAGSDTEN